jgi:hypothetical protein
MLSIDLRFLLDVRVQDSKVEGLIYSLNEADLTHLFSLELLFEGLF